MITVVVSMPMHLVSEANVREHHMARAKRVQQQRAVTRMCLAPRFMGANPEFRQPGWTVRITRIGKRTLDGDNLQSACKAVRDGVADALGLDDGDPRITWAYAQSIGSRYEVRIEVSK